VYLRKEKAGGSSTGHEWLTAGAIVEVPDHVGGELLNHSREFVDVTEEHLFWLAAKELERRKVVVPAEAAHGTPPPDGVPAGGSEPDEGEGDEGDEAFAPNEEGAADAETDQAGVGPSASTKRPNRRRTAIAETNGG
jgi:hypothetical protein